VQALLHQAATEAALIDIANCHCTRHQQLGLLCQLLCWMQINKTMAAQALLQHAAKEAIFTETNN